MKIQIWFEVKCVSFQVKFVYNEKKKMASEKEPGLKNRSYNATNLQDILRSERLEWAEYVWRAESSYTYIRRVLTNKQIKNWSVGRPNQRRMERVRGGLRRLRDEAKIENTKDWVVWRALV